MFKIDSAKLLELNAQRERDWRNAELARADIQINRLADAGGDAQAWRNYRVALRDWPESQGFPQAELRPEAPV
jgi:hypothetical protein